MNQQVTKPKKQNPFRRAARAVITFKWAYLLFAIMFIAAGAGFIAHPAEATMGVSIGVGAIAALFSVIAMCITLSGRRRGFRFWAKMVTTVLGIVTGTVVIVMSAIGNGAAVFQTMLLIVAVYMMIDGSFKLQTAILSKRYKSWLWWVLLVLVIVAIGFGVVALYNGSDMKELIEEIQPVKNEEGVIIEEGNYTIPILLGIALIIDGILNFLSILFLYKIEHGQRADVMRELEEAGVIAVIEDAPAQDPATLDATDTDACAEPEEPERISDGDIV